MKVAGRRPGEPLRLSVERKIAAVVVLAAAVLALVGVLSVRSTRALISEAEWVAHSHLVMEQLEKVLAQMGRLESDQRGYLLTGDESYLGTIRGDGEPLEETFETLRVLVADNPRQTRLVDRLAPLALRRIAARDEVSALRRAEGLEAAIARLRRNRGRHLMRNVRVVVDRMKRRERQLLAVRTMRADRRAVLTLTTITGGSMVALIVLAGMSAWIRRDLQAGAHAEQSLRTVTERFDLALAAAQVGTWSWDTTADIIVWDDYVHPLFGLAPGSFGGSYADFLVLLHPDDREPLARAVRRALAGEGELASECRVVWPDGAEHVVALRGEVYRDAAAAPARLTGVCWDATEERDARDALQRTKEAADAANEAKSEFLTSMSHELRTPMNSIIGFSQLLLRSTRSRLDADDRDALETVQRNAHHLLGLINQVLDLSRVEAGAVALSTTWLDLAALAREVVQTLRPLVGEKAIELVLQTPDLPLVVEGDSMRLRQILTNLVANAIKYTAVGTVTVRVTDGYDAAIGAAASVSVRDTGPGISAADQARLFQRFVRLDTEATRRESGTGLGLSVAQELARMHGGRIDVRSDGRTGSEFVLTLPAVAVCEVTSERAVHAS